MKGATHDGLSKRFNKSVVRRVFGVITSVVFVWAILAGWWWFSGESLERGENLAILWMFGCVVSWIESVVAWDNNIEKV